jgi:hypothetical protein
VKRAFVAVLLAGFGFGATGCGTRALSDPETPARQSEQQTRAPRRHERPLPRLIAPPPAYGNKVVMAKGPADTALN